MHVNGQQGDSLHPWMEIVPIVSYTCKWPPGGQLTSMDGNSPPTLSYICKLIVKSSNDTKYTYVRTYTIKNVSETIDSSYVGTMELQI